MTTKDTNGNAKDRLTVYASVKSLARSFGSSATDFLFLFLDVPGLGMTSVDVSKNRIDVVGSTRKYDSFVGLDGSSERHMSSK